MIYDVWPKQAGGEDHGTRVPRSRMSTPHSKVFETAKYNVEQPLRKLKEMIEQDDYSEMPRIRPSRNIVTALHGQSE